MRSQIRIDSIIAMIFLTMPLVAMAQSGQNSGESHGQVPAGGASHGGGPVDPARFKSMIIEGIKSQLGATDEEWKTLLPKIEKVLDAQRNARTGAGMSFTSPAMVNGKGQGGATMRVQGGGGTNVDTPTGKAMQAIRGALDKETSDEEMRTKIASMHEAKDKAREAVNAAQKELKEACSARQEAVLITLGTLE